MGRKRRNVKGCWVGGNLFSFEVCEQKQHTQVGHWLIRKISLFIPVSSFSCGQALSQEIGHWERVTWESYLKEDIITSSVQLKSITNLLTKFHPTTEEVMKSIWSSRFVYQVDITLKERKSEQFSFLIQANRQELKFSLEIALIKINCFWVKVNIYF